MPSLDVGNTEQAVSKPKNTKRFLKPGFEPGPKQVAAVFGW
jgi:hypothetical protein